MSRYHLRAALLAVALLCVASASHAVPITYDFSASNFTSDRGSVAPVNFVSGNYTIDNYVLVGFNLTVGAHSYTLGELGSKLDQYTVQIGGLVGGGFDTVTYTYGGGNPIGTSFDDFMWLSYLPPFNNSPTFHYTVANIGDLFKATTATVVARNPSAVPVPAAAWLFGSCLFGLTGLARRHKKTSRFSSEFDFAGLRAIDPGWSIS